MCCCVPCICNPCVCGSISHDILYVIGATSNPVRYKRRYQLFTEFCNRMKLNKKVKLLTVELQYGEREFQTDADIKLRTSHELWHKENLINITVQHLPASWKYMAWIDTDIQFVRPDWAEETIELLQLYSILQLFSHAIDLGPDYQTLKVHQGFMYLYKQNGYDCKNPKYETWHPGYAWACTKEAYNGMGGLLEFPILGAADNHMARAFIGQTQSYINSQLHSTYKQKLINFEFHCEKNIKRNVGFVNGTILHYWHGKKKDRKYQERWKILVNNKFNPELDIKKDCYNLWQLSGNKPKLRDELRDYFQSRNEDSIDLE